MTSPLKKKAKRIAISHYFEEELVDADTYEKLLLFIDCIEANKPEILALIKERIRSLSSWNFAEVRKHFNIKGSVPRFSPTVFNTLPQGLLENIKARLEEDLIVSGPYDEGSEARRQSTIVCVLAPIARVFAGNIVLQYESSLGSIAAQGRVEYVLYALNEIIMYVIEAKKDDMAQGKAQLFLQLNAGHVMNSREHVGVLPLSGIVTTGSIWQIFEYNGKRENGFSESTTYNIIDNLEEIVKIIFFQFVRAFRDSCVAFCKAWEDEQRGAKTVTVDWHSSSVDMLELNVGDSITWKCATELGVACMNDQIQLPNTPYGGGFNYTYTFTLAGEFQFRPTVKKAKQGRRTVFVDDPAQDLIRAQTFAAVAMQVYNDVNAATDGLSCKAAFDHITSVL